MTTESLENVGLDGYVGEELPLSMYELIACFHEFFNYEYISIRCGKVVTDFLPYPKFSKSLLS